MTHTTVLPLTDKMIDHYDSMNIILKTKQQKKTIEKYISVLKKPMNKKILKRRKNAHIKTHKKAENKKAKNFKRSYSTYVF